MSQQDSSITNDGSTTPAATSQPGGADTVPVVSPQLQLPAGDQQSPSAGTPSINPVVVPAQTVVATPAADTPTPSAVLPGDVQGQPASSRKKREPRKRAPPKVASTTKTDEQQQQQSPAEQQQQSDQQQQPTAAAVVIPRADPGGELSQSDAGDVRGGETAERGEDPVSIDTAASGREEQKQEKTKAISKQTYQQYYQYAYGRPTTLANTVSARSATAGGMPTGKQYKWDRRFRNFNAPSGGAFKD